LKDERGKDCRHETTARIRFDAFDALLFASLRRKNGRDKARLRKTNYRSGFSSIKSRQNLKLTLSCESASLPPQQLIPERIFLPRLGSELT
jgi:hypothetical protein